MKNNNVISTLCISVGLQQELLFRVIFYCLHPGWRTQPPPRDVILQGQPGAAGWGGLHLQPLVPAHGGGRGTPSLAGLLKAQALLKHGTVTDSLPFLQVKVDLFNAPRACTCNSMAHTSRGRLFLGLMRSIDPRIIKSLALRNSSLQ